ncbi:MAG: hypothetical protein K0T00_1954 [Gaiellaceae bacterium]|nr:hypothetical protein [Gaiellaceae bacterium]
MLGLQSPLPIPDASRAEAYAAAGSSSMSSQRGSACASTPSAIRVSPRTRANSQRYATAFPSTAPMPNDAISHPATRGSAPKRSTTSTGMLTKNATHAASPNANTGVHRRSSGSRRRKRRPRRMPRSSPSSGSGCGRGTSSFRSSAETT